jgi:two-component system, sensor histidine kinase PdtaS
VTNAALIREMHHRIKNNLQTVAMLLRMPAGQTGDPAASAILRSSNSRILSIAAVHEVLSQQGFRMVDVKDVAERIVRLTAQHMVRPDLRVSIVVEGESVVLPSRPATSLALVINELLQNALEHAFAGRCEGAVRIFLGPGPEGFLVEVCDDGVGFDEAAPESLGLEIVRTLVQDDLRGTLDFHTSAAGTRVVLKIPPPAEFREAE